MAKIKIDPQGESHIAGSMLTGFETMCGYCDTYQRYDDAEGTPTCAACIDVAKTILTQCTAKEIKSWRIK